MSELTQTDYLNGKHPVRVLSVDDSAFFRKVLAEILGHDASIQLVGCASDPYDARDRLLALPVDVLTLDLVPRLRRGPKRRLKHSSRGPSPSSKNPRTLPKTGASAKN